MYVINNEHYTIDELRNGYRIITGLDNNNELSENELYKYMADAMKE